MSLLGTALTSIGGKLLGNVVSKTGSWLYSQLPSGAQSFLDTVQDWTGIGSKDIGQAATDLVSQQRALELKDVAPTNMLSSRSRGPSPGTMAKAGQAQLLPLGGTDRVSRALNDARVAEKIMRMTGKAPIPSPNLRLGQTISLSSATPPKTTLAKKFSK